MHRHQPNGLAYYTFSSLASFPDVVHAVTTRRGGVSLAPYASLNISQGLGDDPAAVDENLNRVCVALSLRREQVVSPNQRHTANICRVGRAERGRICAGYDALITDEPDVPLLLRYADCTPVLLHDPVHHAIAVIHSGWRGTVLGIGRAAVAALGAAYGSRPADLVAAIGPSIGPCCYEVGSEVIDAVHAAFARPDELLPVRTAGNSPAGQAGRAPGRRHFDLWAANRRWLVEAGVRQIEVAELCTACHTDDFYSHRAEHGRTGHFGAVMALRRG